MHSDQMVLMMAKQEAGPRTRLLNALEGELENKSSKPRGLVRKLA